MRVMVLVKSTPNSETGQMPDAELLTAMGRYNDDLIAAGVMVGGDGLHPSSAGARLRFNGAEIDEQRGPFAIDSGLVAGYWLWEVASMDEAVAWARRCPHPMPGETAELELRRVFTQEDFAEVLTDEHKEQWDRQQAALDAKAEG
jgi:hypothetical protein